MSLSSILGFLKRWWALLVLGPVVAGAVAIAVVGQIAPVYQANTTLLVNRGNVSATGTEDPTVAESLARTYAEGLKTRPVLSSAAERVGLPASAARDLLAAVTVRTVTGTQLLRLTVEDRNPALAAALANAIVGVFSEQNLDMQAGRYASSRQNLEQLVATLRSEMDTRGAQLQQLRADLPSTDPQLARAESDFAQLQSTYSDTVKTYEGLRVAEARGLNGLTVLEPAIPPTDPVRPNKPQTVALAILAGLIVAAATARLIEYFDDGLHDRDRWALKTGLPVLGSTPAYPVVNGGVLASQAGIGAEGRDTRRAADSYKLLFSSLMLANADGEEQPRTLMVTSAAMNEGKSLTAANLAGVMAEAGHRVILVDADLHRPSHMRRFGLPNSTGLSTLLLNSNVSLDSVLRDTRVPGLRVLTAGPPPADASALYTSRRLGARLAELRDNCDVLVVDTPPVLAQPDATLLCPHLDGVVFVIDARKSRGRQVRRALEILNQAGARVLGAAFNRVPHRALGFVEYADGQSAQVQTEGGPSASTAEKKPAPGSAA